MTIPGFNGDDSLGKASRTYFWYGEMAGPAAISAAFGEGASEGGEYDEGEMSESGDLDSSNGEEADESEGDLEG